MIRTASILSQDDPLTLAMRPPTSETDVEKAARLKTETEAKRISEKIDEDLKQERQRLQKSKDDVKVRKNISPKGGQQTLLFMIVGPC